MESTIHLETAVQSMMLSSVMTSPPVLAPHNRIPLWNGQQPPKYGMVNRKDPISIAIATARHENLDLLFTHIPDCHTEAPPSHKRPLVVRHGHVTPNNVTRVTRDRELKDIVKRLRSKNEKALKDVDIIYILKQAILEFRSAPSEDFSVDFDDKTKFTVVGDIHGNFRQLVSYFRRHGEPSQHSYVFLGDYTDRGPYNLETLMLLLCYRMLYPLNFIMIRGNHESIICNMMYGFLLELELLYRDKYLQIRSLIGDLYKLLPLCAQSERLVLLHGGFSRKFSKPNTLAYYKTHYKSLPDREKSEIEQDMLWSSPDTSLVDKNRDGTWLFNTARGCGKLYSAAASRACLEANKKQLVIRGHDDANGGILYSENAGALTLHSVTNACRKNDACVLDIDYNNNVPRYQVTRYSSKALMGDVTANRINPLLQRAVLWKPTKPIPAANSAIYQRLNGVLFDNKN